MLKDIKSINRLGIIVEFNKDIIYFYINILPGNNKFVLYKDI